eukprot:6192927-Pleurochrysis_carterae.AAC.2
MYRAHRVNGPMNVAYVCNKAIMRAHVSRNQLPALFDLARLFLNKLPTDRRKVRHEVFDCRITHIEEKALSLHPGQHARMHTSTLRHAISLRARDREHVLACTRVKEATLTSTCVHVH